jgi:hypothetical protein
MDTYDEGSYYSDDEWNDLMDERAEREEYYDDEYLDEIQDDEEDEPWGESALTDGERNA